MKDGHVGSRRLVVGLALTTLIGCGGGAAGKGGASTTPDQTGGGGAPAGDPQPGGDAPIGMIGDRAAVVCGSDVDAAIDHYNRAIQLDRDGDTAGAVTEYQAAIAADPRYCDAMDNLGVVFRRSGRVDEAIAMYERSLAIAPRNQFAWQNIGVAYRVSKRHDDAVRAYQRLTELSPDNPEGWFGLAQMALITHRAGDARTAARRAEALYLAGSSPLVDDARLLLGLAALDLSDWALVRETLVPLYDRVGDMPEVNLGLGRAFLEPGHVDRARARTYLQRARDQGATVPDDLWRQAQ